MYQQKKAILMVKKFKGDVKIKDSSSTFRGEIINTEGNEVTLKNPESTIKIEYKAIKGIYLNNDDVDIILEWK